MTKTLMLRVDVDDLRLLLHIQEETGGSMSDVLRWALRWYAAGGPHRDPDNVLPIDVKEILERRMVGPQLLEGVE